MTKQNILNIFHDTGGILSGHFQLTSGRHSDTYMQCAKLFTHPEESRALCSELAKELEGYNAEIVISPAVGGVLMGYEMARQLDAINIFAERVDGKMELRRGFEIKPWQRVLVVEDVVTTGGSVREVIDLVRAYCGTVVAVASIVDRSNREVKFDVPFHKLLTLDVQSYSPEECPLCKQNIPVTKPGSRFIK